MINLTLKSSWIQWCSKPTLYGTLFLIKLQVKKVTYITINLRKIESKGYLI